MDSLGEEDESMREAWRRVEKALVRRRKRSESDDRDERREDVDDDEIE